MRCVSTADHEVPEPAPLILEVGDIVRPVVGTRSRRLSCSFLPRSVRGWVPFRHIGIDGSTGTVRVEYDTTEFLASFSARSQMSFGTTRKAASRGVGTGTVGSDGFPTVCLPLGDACSARSQVRNEQKAMPATWAWPGFL